MSFRPFTPGRHVDVQSRCISLQNLAQSAIADRLGEPTAGVGWSPDSTTTVACTKKGHKARRREGDKCFFLKFFFLARIFPGLDRIARPLPSSDCRDGI